MKATHLITAGVAAVAAIVAAIAQPVVHLTPQQREISAPAAIKAKLATIRAELQQKGQHFAVGYTRALDQPRETLLGDVDDPQMTREARISFTNKGLQTLKEDEDARVKYLLAHPDMRRTIPDITIVRLACSAKLKSWDWRAHGKVTPVRHQTCGNCWAFAATAAYEGSQLMRNNSTTDESEQYLNDCATTDAGADAGSCGGGLAAKAFEHMVRVGDATEAQLPYTGTDKVCPAGLSAGKKSVAWGYVDPAVDFATRDQIKQALCTYGPLATRMRVVSDAIFAYAPTEPYNPATDVYYEHVASDSDGGGHAVSIVGWDDNRQAWLIKNSWDTDWGEGGYGWIRYDSNRIGRHTAWIKARSNFYVFKPAMEHEITPMKPVIPAPH